MFKSNSLRILFICVQDRTNELTYLIREATEPFRVQKDLRKVVFCAVSTERTGYPDGEPWRKEGWVPAQGDDSVQNQQAALQLLSNVSHLRTVRIGFLEWGRDRAGQTVGDSPEEWKDRSWWN